jgi:putative membrane protein
VAKTKNEMPVNQGAPNLELAKKLNRIAWVITIVILGIVGTMRRIHIDTSIDFSFLPAFHSSLNAITAVILIAALIQIKQGNVAAHRKLMITALLSSCLFLLSYITYHITTPETVYCGIGAVRTLYLVILITHVILAAVIVPFVLFTFIRAYTNQIDKHRRMARWVFPVWLYVAVSGPVVYLMLLACST